MAATAGVKEKVKCLNPKCGNLSFCRGLCHADYQAAWKLVEAGKTSWEALVSAGLALPAGTRGLGHRNGFRELILAGVAEEEARKVG